MSDVWVNTGTDEIAPCPFCQGRKLSIYMQRRLRAVQCSNCGAVGPTGHSRQEAVTLWNEQPQLAAATQRAEAAEAQLAAVPRGANAGLATTRGDSMNNETIAEMVQNWFSAAGNGLIAQTPDELVSRIKRREQWIKGEIEWRDKLIYQHLDNLTAAEAQLAAVPDYASYYTTAVQLSRISGETPMTFAAWLADAQPEVQP